ncbi:MAG: helix-hairpin-helix domain-containing protein [Mycobacteriaceae bacterium]
MSHAIDPRERLRERLGARRAVNIAEEQERPPLQSAEVVGFDGDVDSETEPVFHQSDLRPHWLLSDAPHDVERQQQFISQKMRGSRWLTGYRGALSLAGFAVAVLVVTFFVGWRDRPQIQAAVPNLPPVQMAAEQKKETTPQAPTKLVVSVVGLVATPGLVQLDEGARVADALKAAGGSLDGADLLGLNMAQHITDGDQIVVGIAPHPGGIPKMGSGLNNSTAQSGGYSSSGKTAPSAKVNLNTATEAQLDALPGVGPVTAAAIISWRTDNGHFTSVNQLADVTGIGPARLESLRDLVTL